MAQIRKSALTGVQPGHLIPPATLARLTQSQLGDRLAHVASLLERANGTRDPVIASCYRQVAKAALTARPPGEVAQEVRNLRVKASQMGPSGPRDALLRRADELEAQNPVAPRRAGVRKAAGEPGLVALYDCDGTLFGVASEDDITEALDPGVVAKAASVGMVATHHPKTGRVTGFVHPDRVTPVIPEPAAQAKDTGPVKAGGETGMGEPRRTGPPAALPDDGPQAVLPGDLPDRQVIKMTPQTRRMIEKAVGEGVAEALGRDRRAARSRDPRRL
jgi:hypothetical protein